MLPAAYSPKAAQNPKLAMIRHIAIPRKNVSQQSTVLANEPKLHDSKVLGEISPHEFKDFIGPNMRLECLPLAPNEDFSEMLTFYRGKNTRERQKFIIENLKMNV